jgi:hypothetical protein
VSGPVSTFEPEESGMTAERRAFHYAAQKQRICRGCRAKWPWHPHHVVYEQEVKRLGGDVNDVRNALRLCPDCHANHHGRSRPIKLTQLTDANYEFAFELMGERAADYLRQKYDGDDPRLEEWVQRVRD